MVQLRNRKAIKGSGDITILKITKCAVILKPKSGSSSCGPGERRERASADA
jgi:hypothetical protein